MEFYNKGMIPIKYLANGITTSRILSSAFMLFTEPFSVGFYFLYTFCGITDMIDGTIARRLHTESNTGALLDSIGDSIFLLVVFIKLFPVLINMFPPWILWFVISIALIRFIAYTIGALKFHRFVSLHTIANKITGAALFCFPYYVLRTDVSVISIILCMIAEISAIEELMINIRSKYFNPDIRSIFEI